MARGGTLEVIMLYRNEDFFQVIGRISVFFSTWDLLTTLLTMRLVKRQTRLPVNFDRRTLPQKLRFLGELSAPEVVDPDVLKEVKLELPAALSVAGKRNRYIHDQWVFTPTWCGEARSAFYL